MFSIILVSLLFSQETHNTETQNEENITFPWNSIWFRQLWLEEEEEKRRSCEFI